MTAVFPKSLYITAIPELLEHSIIRKMSTPRVHFPHHVVTSITRGPTSPELSLIREYDDHVLSCRICESNNLLFCAVGMAVVGDLTELVYCSRGQFFSTRSDTSLLIYIEIPQHYKYTRRFLQRSGGRIRWMRRIAFRYG